MRAAAYIEEHGWCQRAMEDASGRVCLIEAITSTGGYLDGVGAAIERLIGPDFISWNDAPGRTQTEVVKMLRAAAIERLRVANPT
jgi:hypothetical protein